MNMRLAPVPGEWIDRTRPLSLRFEGIVHTGFAGDTVTSALAADGVRLLGRSFKYHRPRGVLSLANHDVNAMVQDGPRLNVRADVTPLTEGMVLQAANVFGGLASDRGRFIEWLAPFLPVGFYYKAFHTPARWFPFWERMFRRMTGLGRLDFSTPRVRTPKRYDCCDVLVIGAGPSGLSAALQAARSGLSVILVDENAQMGGSLGYQRNGTDTALHQLRDLQARVAAQPRLRVVTGTFAAGYYADHWVPLVDATCMTKVRARAVIFATGAFEQPAVFRNNDRPGIMLSSAARRLIYRYAVRPMTVAVVLTANADGYGAALDLLAAGVKVAAVVDLRPEDADIPAKRQVVARKIPVLTGHCIIEALGRHEVRAVSVCPVESDGTPRMTETRIVTCDGVVMAVGYGPAAGLLSQAGARMEYDARLEQFVPTELPSGIFAAGQVNGVHDMADRMEDGRRAGTAAARHLGKQLEAAPVVARASGGVNHPYPVVHHPCGKNFVDFDEDLQVADLENAVQEGFDNIELLKRFSTVGMGPSQGKHSNTNAIRLLARLRHETPGDVGSTTARPFFHPVPLSHLAGRAFHPTRRTPLHAWHARAGAVFMQAGDWLRPEFYARDGLSRADGVRAEVHAVRNAVGLIDVGTLGKLQVSGPQAGDFLERLYTGRFTNMKTGTTRYALMLDESGVIVDDGVVARLAEQRFYVTTTTTASAPVYREMTRLNTLWAMDVGIVNVTGTYAAMNLAGPLAREVLGAHADLDLSATAFPYLGVREGALFGVPARVLRVGFVGELGFEIHVPAQFAARIWEGLMEEGAAKGIRPFGVEAQRRLRLEKGHVIIGQDTDGLTTPLDAGMDWALKMDKPYFIGQRSLRVVHKKALAKKLVGFELEEGTSASIPKECHLVIHAGAIAGRVTSIVRSETLGRHVGLAFLDTALAVPGARFEIRGDGGVMAAARVVPTPFYDPAGERQKGGA
jgi:sarcosine oxidase subunit alpha